MGIQVKVFILCFYNNQVAVVRTGLLSIFVLSSWELAKSMRKEAETQTIMN